MVTEIIKERVKNNIYKVFKKYNIHKNIDENINIQTDLDYIESLGFSDYLQITDEKMLDLVKSGKLDRTDAITITGLINQLSIYWILCNGVRFLVDFNEVNKRKFDLDKKFLRQLNKSDIKDFIFDFKGEDIKYNCRLQKQHELIKIKDKFYENWQFTYTYISSEVISFDALIIPELYPKIYKLNYSEQSICKDCDRCTLLSDHVELKQQTGKIVTRHFMDLMIIPRNLTYTRESSCGLKDIKVNNKYIMPYNFRDILMSCMYAVNKYLSRKTIIRDPIEKERINSEVKLYNPNKEERKNVRFVDITDFVKYERKERRESLGGHHASPREHHRRETYRHLKSGKVVYVKASTVNKGKGNVHKQTIYKVN